MKEKIKCCLLWIIAIFAVVYFFDINLREIYSTVQTAFIDNIDSIFPGAKGQFENIDSQLSNAIIKNGTAKTIRSKTLEAKQNTSSFIKHKWLIVKKLALKRNINIDNLLAQFKKKSKFKYYKHKRSVLPKNQTYSFDYKSMSVARASAIRQNFINYSLSLHGTPYVLGGENPERGLDCSSFVQYSAKKGVDIDLPRTAYAQYESSVKIPFSESEPGDLLFFRTYGKVSHVGIYLGRYEGEGPWYGKHIFINAASEGPRTGVTISTLEAPYWRNHYSSSGRFMPSSKEIIEAAEVSGK